MIVLDASAALHLLLDGGHAELVRKSVAGKWVCAPEIILAEVGDHLRRRELARSTTANRALGSLRDLIDQVRELARLEPLVERAWQLRANVTVADALYVALAEARECPLLTTDARLARGAAAVSSIEVIAP